MQTNLYSSTTQWLMSNAAEYPDGQAMAGAEAFRHFKRYVSNGSWVISNRSNLSI